MVSEDPASSTALGAISIPSNFRDWKTAFSLPTSIFTESNPFSLAKNSALISYTKSVSSPSETSATPLHGSRRSRRAISPRTRVASVGEVSIQRESNRAKTSKRSLCNTTFNCRKDPRFKLSGAPDSVAGKDQ